MHLNAYGETLFDDERFQVADTPKVVETVELMVAHLDFPKGATLSEIFTKIQMLGLELCPLEVAPLLRLAYLEQADGASGQPQKKYQAPVGAVTVASPLLSPLDTFPKGFYLRNIKGDLWLRGYTCDDTHVFQPEDTFVFCTPASVL